MTRGRLHIIASCSDRKRRDAGAPVCLRDVSWDPGRVERWWARLHEVPRRVLPAHDLYVGSHWAVVRDLPTVAARHGFEPMLWVASAGYGLVPASTPLSAYSATFGVGHPDSVVGPDRGRAARATHAAWWASLAQFEVSGSSAPRTIRDMAHRDRAARILVVGSPDYVAAMGPDLLAARDALRDRDQLVIVSSEKTSHLDGLEDQLAPADARLLAAFGRGSRVSLHGLAARKILEEVEAFELSASVQRARFKALLATLPPYEQPRGRIARTDDDVRAFIQSAIARAHRPAHTRLLREFRAGGHQCEQSRFRRLYREVTAHAG